MQQLIFAVILSFVISLAVGELVLPLLRRMKLGQFVRDDGPQSHLKKQGTPTMGGVIMIVGVVITSLALAKGDQQMLVVAVLSVVCYGIVGFLDDFIKTVKKRSLGLKPYQKALAQLGFAVAIAIYAYQNPEIGSAIRLPFTDIDWNMGWLFIPFVIIAVLGTVNGCNLTDGLDGLNSSVTLIFSAGFSVIYYVLSQQAADNGQALLAGDYRNMMVFCAAVAGACLAFLHFNAHPAKVFMGDTGSLALGGAVVYMAVAAKMPLWLLFMGGIYLASCVSVILQVGSYRLRHGKRIFKMAPLHHHFELCGYPETKVVSMYMIAATVLCLIGLLAVR